MLADLKALAVFAATVEQGSFRKAARALALSPSVVSHHVASLERRLATPLLYRTTRKLALTAAGEQLFIHAREMARAAKLGLDAINGEAGTGAGTLRMTAPAILVDTAFSSDIAAFVRAHPQIELRLDFTEQRRDLVRDGLDLAIRIGQLADSTLVAKRVATMPRVLVGAPSYVATRPRPRTLADLQGWDFVRLSETRPQLELVPPGRKTPRTLTLAAKLTTDSATAMRELVLAGAGLAAIPEVVARRALARGQLVEVLPAWRLTARDVYAVWPGGPARAPLTARLVQFLEPRLRALFEP